MPRKRPAHSPCYCRARTSNGECRPTKQGRHGDDVARIEIRRRKLAFQFRLPQIIPALELHAAHEVGAITDGVDIGPGPEMKRTYPRLIGQVFGVRNLGNIELLEQPVIGIEPANM